MQKEAASCSGPKYAALEEEEEVPKKNMMGWPIHRTSRKIFQVRKMDVQLTNTLEDAPSVLLGHADNSECTRFCGYQNLPNIIGGFYQLRGSLYPN